MNLRLNRTSWRRPRKAADRYISSSPDDLPPGFSIHYADGPQHLDGHAHGFAFDKALEALTMHPVTWPIIKEPTGNKPRFTSGTLAVNTARHRFHPLHSLREDVAQSGPEMPRYFTQDGRVYSDNFVTFFYLTDVYPGCILLSRWTCNRTCSLGRCGCHRRRSALPSRTFEPLA